MRNSIKILCLFILLLGCKNNGLSIEENDIIQIDILSKKEIQVVKRKEEINTLIRCLNQNNREPSKFLPNLKLFFISKKDTIIVTVNSFSLSDENGVKYRTACDVEKMAENIIRKNKRTH